MTDGYLKTWILREESTEGELSVRGPQAHPRTLNRNIFKPVVIRGLPGIGKTTLANEVQACFASAGRTVFRINADTVRDSICRDLGFSHEDRATNARRIGGLVRMASLQGFQVVVDFVMPTALTVTHYLNAARGLKTQIFSLEPDPGFKGRFKDTNNLWESALGWEREVASGELIIPIKPLAPTDIGQIASSIVHHCITSPTVEL